MMRSEKIENQPKSTKCRLKCEECGEYIEPGFINNAEHLLGDCKVRKAREAEKAWLLPYGGLPYGAQFKVVHDEQFKPIKITQEEMEHQTAQQRMRDGEWNEADLQNALLNNRNSTEEVNTIFDFNKDVETESYIKSVSDDIINRLSAYGIDIQNNILQLVINRTITSRKQEIDKKDAAIEKLQQEKEALIQSFSNIPTKYAPMEFKSSKGVSSFS